jgi:hypothetical protein
VCRLKSARTRGEVRRSQGGMEVIVEDNPCVNLQALVLAAIFQRIRQNLAPLCRGENWQPRHHRAGDEIGAVWVVDAIAASHGPSVREAKLRRQVRSQVQLGNEGAGSFRVRERSPAASASDQ